MKPTFQPIELERQADYNSLLKRCPQVASDYSFVNIWGWAEAYELSWAWEGPCVWIRQDQPQRVYWAPVGDWAAMEWRLEQFDRSCTYIRVPDQLAALWQRRFGPKILTETDRGQWDYIYSTSDLAALGGNRYHKKKNLLNQFLKKYDYTYRPLTFDSVEAALNLQNDWCTWRDCEAFDVLAAENQVIAKVLRNWPSLGGLLGGALWVDDRMVAYTVGEALGDDTLVIHFEKGDPNYKGVYQAINQMFVSHHQNDFVWTNREQDLGDPGLRKAKTSYHPTDYIQKSRVSFPDES